MINKTLIICLGIVGAHCASDYGTITTEHSRNPNPSSTMALSKANIGIVLDVLESRQQQHIDSELIDVKKALAAFNSPNKNIGDPRSEGILMETVPSDPLNDMDSNAESIVKVSPLSHMVNFPYDPLPVPEYERIGDGNVVHGTFNVENLAKAANIARVVQESNPAQLKMRVEDGQFKTLEDVLTTYNALKAYLIFFESK